MSTISSCVYVIEDMMNTLVPQSALQMLISKEILDAFEMEKTEKVGGGTRIFHMAGKENRVPPMDKPLKKDGYMRGFPKRPQKTCQNGRKIPFLTNSNPPFRKIVP